MGAFIDLTDKTFGRLYVVEEAGRDKWKRATWLCKCECGNEVVVYSINLRSGHTQSCGCLNLEKVAERNKNNKYGYKHGLCGTKAYNNARCQKRNAMKLNQTPKNVNLTKIQLYYTICAYLNKPCEVPMWHVDHIQPLSKGGLHHEDNLQILTAEINLEKYNKYPLTKEEKVKYTGLKL